MAKSQEDQIRDLEQLVLTVHTERTAFLDLLKEAPPRSMIDDQRYWDWRRKVDALLLKVKE